MFEHKDQVMKNRTKTIIITLFVIITGAAAFVGWWFYGREEPLPDGLIQANGRIEGDHYIVAGKASGRIMKLGAREGDSVKKGQIMAQLDDAQVKAGVTRAKAGVGVSKARFSAARIKLEILKKDVPLKIDTAKADVSHARAQLVAAKADARQAGRDAARMKILLKKGTVEKHRSEKTDLAWTTKRSALITAREVLKQAQKRLAETELGLAQIKAREDEVKGYKAQVAQAEAALTEARSLLDDLTIHAPATGVITTRIVNSGEVVAAGSPMFDIVDLDRLYLKVYIPEKVIGKVRLGLLARIYTDAFPDKPFPAKIRYIASQAEFTPKEVQTPDERVKLVYAVRLYLDSNPEHRLTPGLPADAVIRWKEKTPWAKPLR